MIEFPVSKQTFFSSRETKRTLLYGLLLGSNTVYIRLLRWVWINTYRYIFSGMNIHLPAILGFTRYQGFDPSPDEDFRKWMIFGNIQHPPWRNSKPWVLLARSLQSSPVISSDVRGMEALSDRHDRMLYAIRKNLQARQSRLHPRTQSFFQRHDK